MSKSLPSNRRRHAPLTPSPLNPNNTTSTTTTHLNSTKTRRHQPSKTSNTPNPSSSSNPSLAQKYALLVHASPTERLLRQKAALAWRSETLRQQPQPQPSSTAVSSNSDNNRRYHHHPATTTAAFLAGQKRRADGEKQQQQQHPALHRHHLRLGGGWEDVDLVVSVPESELWDSRSAGEEEEEEEGGGIGLTATIIPATKTTTTTIIAGGGKPPADASGLRFEGFIRFDDGYGDGIDVSRPLMRAGMDRVRGGRRRCHGRGAVGGGITVRRVVVVVVVFLGLGLVHGLVRAFGTGGGGVGGGRRPLAAES
ncbi:hypothetical protein C8A00DRAFT_28797 [Chaetomidium leptoderma]|uniref:Uncharacterized protein n=1 Tax=Chaetomidium leptoderma TaxID=669021 RepID=A0AAN6VVN8_9PEZI|nr:hypothetical protein C8A00DRAFT_28797 [Chaetomidium leptoderma]